MEEKRCSKCKEIKPVEEFYTNQKTSDGFQTYCKTCCKERMKTQDGKASNANSPSAKKRYADVMMQRLHISDSDY